MHLAFTHQPIASKTSYRVASVATWENRLLVGTNNGQVYPFRYSNRKDSFIMSTSGRVGFPSSRSVNKLAVIPEWGVLIALIGTSVYFCDIANLGGPKLELSGSKGCTLFNWAAAEGKLFVAIKKRLCIYEWKGHEAGFELQASSMHNLPDTPRMLQWCGGHRLVIGFKQEYDLLDIRSAKFSEMLKVKSGTEPVSAVELGPKKTTLVLANGPQGHIFTINPKNGKIAIGGRPGGGAIAGVGGGRKGGGGAIGAGGSSMFAWSDVPTSIKFCGPFLIAALPRCIELHNVSNKSLTQRFTLTGKLAISKLARDATSWSFVVVVAQATSLIQLQMEPVLHQIKALMDHKRYDEIFSLCTLLDMEQPENLHQYQSTHSQCGFDWFSDNLFVADAKGSKITWKQKYETAVGHFIEANEDYRRVLALFPKLHAHLQPLAMALPPNIRTHANPQDIPIERPDFRETYKYGCAIKAFVQFLTAYRRRFYDETGQLIIRMDAGTGSSSAAAAATTQYDAEAVDTLILLSYLDMPDTKDTTIIEFLTSPGPHSCNVRVCQPILERNKKYAVLLELYRTRGCHEQALQLLQRLEASKQRLVVVSSAMNASKPSKPVPKNLMEYLSKLDGSFQDLLFEYSKPVLTLEQPQFDENINDILRIFTKPRPPGAVPLDPHAVVKHLTSSLALSKSCFENYKLALLYLKDLLIVKPQVRAKFIAARKRLGSSDLADAAGAPGGMKPDEVLESSPAETDRGLHKELIEMYLFSIDDLIRQQEEEQGHARTICLALEDRGMVRAYRLELIQILKTSKYYSPEEMLNMFPENKLLEERAILLGCLGQYERAIFIYINNLRKPDAAEDYCNDVYVREECHGPHPAYLALLKVHLKKYFSKNTPLSPKRVSDLMRLLQRHHSRIDPVLALKVVRFLANWQAYLSLTTLLSAYSISSVM
eukprot:INCI665.2.p1 GENE.INCI665.2~~INCI665.2.p1  ORF type:complete len:937 (+),score=132.78 INCI665.2:197-3007(+)